MNHKNENLDSIQSDKKDITKKEKINTHKCNSFNDINQLNNTILNIKKDIINIKLREQAEIENIKKNVNKKIHEIKKTQLQYFCTHLIPILDSLKNIKNIAYKLNIKHNKIIEGISLTLKSLLNIVQKFDLIIEKEKNIKFNTSLHQTESNEIINDTDTYYVSSIIRDGYICQGKIIRKAIVKIKKEI
ncbi:MAG: nucleotide exchange factor GrpE [Buchnera aphidicola (Floraphis choui)]